MSAVREANGTDFGVETRRAALEDWRRRARAAEPHGLLARHPIAASVAVGIACGVAFALWRNMHADVRPQRRSPPRNGRAPS